VAWKVEPIEVVKAKDKIVDPRDKKTLPKENNYYQWWLAKDDKELLAQLLSPCTS